MTTSSTKRVLLVEDDEHTQFMMSELIRLIGAEVDVAQDGQKCLDRIASEPDAYGLILMDIHMPVLDGVEATRQIRSNEADPPKGITIIAVSADTYFHEDEVIHDSQMNGVLSKPVNAAELATLLEEHALVA